jgi:hypothetical protein
MTEIKNSVLAGLCFGLLFGLFLALFLNNLNAFIGGLITGIVFGIFVFFFVTSKAVKQQTQIENLGGKPIRYSGGANHFMNGEAVGGKLYLLADKLQFQSHSFNIQNHGQIIEFKQIKDVSFYNTLGLIPNGLGIVTIDGKVEKFVVNDRKMWKVLIEKEMQNSF